MSGGWLYRTGSGEAGPISEDALLALVRAGTITASTLLRREGGTADSPAGEAVPRAFATPPAYAGPPLRGGAWQDLPPRPWRRFWARFLDIAILGDALFSILAAQLPRVAPIDATDMDAFLATRLGTALEVFLATLFVLPVNAALMARLGTTLGKRVFQIRMLKDGARLDFRTALRREMLAWGRGQAFGLPLVDLFAMAAAYRDLKTNGTTPWDAEFGLRVSYKPLSRLTVVGLFVAALVIAALVLISFAL